MGHATFMWLEDSLLFHTNAGDRSEDKEAGITFYHIPDPKKISPQIIEKLRKKNRNYIEKGIIQELNLEKIAVLPSQDQKGAFCSVRSFLLLMKGILLIKHMGPIDSKEMFLKKFRESKEAISPVYKLAKEGVMDFELGQLLSLYESKECIFQQETPLLLICRCQTRLDRPACFRCHP
jgi:hypothetical protein